MLIAQVANFRHNLQVLQQMVVPVNYAVILSLYDGQRDILSLGARRATLGPICSCNRFVAIGLDSDTPFSVLP
jgi:hypothetical protein